MKQTKLEKYFGDLWCNRWIEQLHGLQFEFDGKNGYRSIWICVPHENFSEFFVLRKCSANFEQIYILDKMHLSLLISIHDFYQHENNYSTMRYDNFWNMFWKQNGHREIITLTNVERVFADEYIVSQIIRF